MDLIIKISQKDYERIINIEDKMTDYQTTLRLYKAVKEGKEKKDDKR